VIFMSNSYIYIYTYITLPIYNSDEVITARVKIENFLLRLFVKGGSFQYHPSIQTANAMLGLVQT